MHKSKLLSGLGYSPHPRIDPRCPVCDSTDLCEVEDGYICFECGEAQTTQPRVRDDDIYPLRFDLED